MKVLDAEEKETAEMAKSHAFIIIRNLGVDALNSKIIGSFPRKGYAAKDIDVAVEVKDARQLVGTKIISSKTDGKLLDIFITDKDGRNGVFEDRGFFSHFKPLNFKVKKTKMEKYLKL